MQISQFSHVFTHAATCVHGLHLVGSFTVLMLQLPVPAGFSEPSHTVGSGGGAAHTDKAIGAADADRPAQADGGVALGLD